MSTAIPPRPDEQQLLLDKVRACVAKTLRIEPERVGADASLIDDLGAESIDFMELRFYLEDDLGVAFEDADIALIAGGKDRALLANITARRIAAEITRRRG